MNSPLAWNQPEVHDVWRRRRAMCEEYTARDGIEHLLVDEVSVPSAREHALVVPLVVFFAFQKHFVRGVMAGSVK
ncbi:hypothetical protein ACFRAO_08820 [Streptomyces sp. NPDC056656]|uniref:hypothetical protein n=1 Tax=Streptomyces sp. NPDC056656 TaxID=3345895 RepID=UPI0036B2CD1A